MIKEEWELERMRKAMDITRLGIEAMMRTAKPNQKEYEIEAAYDYTLMVNGAREKAFRTIAAGGKRGTILHYVENNQTVADGELILIDAGAQWQWYNGDISRTFPVNGKFTERQKLVYNIVLEGQRRVIDAIRPGVQFSSLNELLKDDSEERTELELSGLDPDELEFMDPDERREVLEDAGLDPDEYDF